MYIFVAETISNALLIPVLVACLYVMRIWGPALWRAIRGRNRLSADNLFIAGVFAAFTGELLDNAYWGAAWAAHYLGVGAKDWLFDHGVVANIPFRQTACLVAAYLHVLSALRRRAELGEPKPAPWAALAASGVAGVAFVVVLALLR